MWRFFGSKRNDEPKEYQESRNPDDLLPWLIQIHPFMTPHASSGGSAGGTWSPSLFAGNPLYGRMQNSDAASTAVGAYLAWDVVLSAGTWEFKAFNYETSNRAIYAVKLDGVSVGTIDTYDAGDVPNAVNTISGITVGTTGKKTLRVEITGKHASSGGYYVSFSLISLRRTA